MGKEPRTKGETTALSSTRLASWMPILVALSLYAPCLGSGMITDDRALIVDNPYLASSAGWLGLMTRDLWAASALSQSTEYYRPLPMLTYWLQIQTLGNGLVWLRAGNLLLLCLSARALGSLLRRQWPKVSPAVVGFLSCAWVAHPLQTEPVIWLAGRFDLCVVLGVICTLRFNLGGRRNWLVPFALAATLLSKEVAVVVLPVLVVQDGGAGRSFRSELGKYSALGALLLSYFVLRHVIGVASASAVATTTPLGFAQSYAVTAATFTRLLVVPLGLDVHHWYRPLAGWFTIVVLGLVIAAVALGFTRRKRAGGLSSGLFLALASLGPVALVGPNQRVFGDRFACLFLLGLVIAAPALRIRAAETQLGRGLLLALIAVWSILTWQRGREWSSMKTLRAAALGRDPENPHWRVLEAHARLDSERPREAAAILRGVVRDVPDYGKGWNALCVAGLRSPRPEPFTGSACLNAVTLDPGNPSVWINQAAYFTSRGLWMEAIERAERSLTFRASYPEAEYILALSLANLGREPEARIHLARGLSEDVDHPGLRMLAAQMQRHGQKQQANTP